MGFWSPEGGGEREDIVICHDKIVVESRQSLESSFQPKQIRGENTSLLVRYTHTVGETEMSMLFLIEHAILKPISPYLFVMGLPEPPVLTRELAATSWYVPVRRL